MSLLTPESGLLFWMLIAFGTVFFVVAKFGFPVITHMVDERKQFIDKALEDAKTAEAKMARIHEECDSLLGKARDEQDQIIREAKAVSKKMMDEARSKAQDEAQKMLAEARKQIEDEKRNALLDIRREVAELSVQIAEKVVRKELAHDSQQMDYVNRLLDEVGKK